MSPAHQDLVVQKLRRVIYALMATVVVLVAALGICWPRVNTYDGLLQENLELKAIIQQIDRQMAEIDRILLRLRLYDAQLKSLSEPKGAHGPLSEEAFANNRIMAAAELGQSPIEESHNMEPSDLRPAEAWAEAVQARADTFLALFAEAEPNLNELMRELEDIRALEAALPAAWPVHGTLTSGFGYRHSPFAHRRDWKFHSGLDISNERGTPIYAPAPGKVIMATYNSGYGRMVELDHGFGISTVYAHCNSLRVEKGDVVKQGEFIATVGSTGRTTGPHLHFEVRLDGHPVDPLDYLPR